MSGAKPRPFPWSARRVAPRTPHTQGGARPAIPDPAGQHGSARPGRPDEVHLSSLAADDFARMTLALMRWHFQTFAAPETQGWLMALRVASAQVGPRGAGAFCYDLVALVQALRAARSSPFRFNPESCACCRDWLTPEERQMMALLEALRRGQTGRARTLVQLLCDGNPDGDLIAMAEVYLRHNAPEHQCAGKPYGEPARTGRGG